MKQIYTTPVVEVMTTEVKATLLAASLGNGELNSMDFDSNLQGDEQMVKGDCIWDEE